MSDPILHREDTGPVACLTLNNPAKLNPLSDAMLAALTATFDDLRADGAIRAVVIRGAGKAFCAGHDLREMTAGRQAEDGGRAYFADLFARCSVVMAGIRDLPQPVIAEVHGIATAAGCQLVASCDMAVAATGTRFGVNGVNIGLFCSTPMVALSRNIPRKRAFEMLVTGDFITAETALELGLVNHVVPENALRQTTDALAARCAEKLGAAVRIGKKAFYAQAEMGLDAAYGYVGEVMVENMLYAETEKGIAAFLNKETPVWDQ